MPASSEKLWAKLVWLQMDNDVSGKAPVGCWPGVTPDPDPEERLGLQVRDREPQSGCGGLWGQEAMVVLIPPAPEHQLILVRTLSLP